MHYAFFSYPNLPKNQKTTYLPSYAQIYLAKNKLLNHENIRDDLLINFFIRVWNPNLNHIQT